MRHNLILGLVIVLGTAALASASAGTVYVSNPEAYTIYAVATTGGTPTAVYTDAATAFEDMVVGPEGALYACAPADGLIVRLDPQAPPAPGAAEVVYQAAPADALQQPQCGWFLADGSLVVTDAAPGSGVWRLAPDGLGGFAPPANLLDASDLGAGFAGGGVTQAADGDLLVVDRAAGVVWSLAIDPYSRDFLPHTTPTVLVSGLDEPVGVARAKDGTVYVASDAGLAAFDSDGAPTALPACIAFGRKDRPFFADLSADLSLYVATTSNKAGTLWRFDLAGGGCTATALAVFRRPDFQPSAVGTAVPAAGRAGVAVTGFVDDPDVQLFSFGDSAYEFLPNNGCQAEISMREATPSEAAALIATVPGLSADPVLGLGDNGRVRIYDIQPAPGASCPTGDPNLYRHALNAFFGYVPNPRILRCPDCPGGVGTCPPAGRACEVTELSSYFPFNGILPDDERVGTRTPRFSEYLPIDVDLAEDVDTGNGVFCGFEPPATAPAGLDYTDPDLLDDPAVRALLPEFTTTETVPLKFRVAAIQPDGTYSCAAGPYIDNAVILLSIARVRTPDPGSIEQFAPANVISAGGSGVEDPAIFGNPANPNQYFHYNTKFTGFAPGYYQLVLVPLTDNFPAVVRYIEVVP